MELEDLSFSSIVNLLQGDANKAADLLDKIARKKAENISEMERMEKELAKLRNIDNMLYIGAENIMNHLGKECPLSVIRENYIVLVTVNDVTIETNVL